ncbi:MAG: hypothetical protein Q9208_006926 [Pyrenodesmia sp. 3 TL-2023]
MKRKRRAGSSPSVKESGRSLTPVSDDDSLRYGNNPIVVLKVGPKKTRFDVHKRQLCEASPFFEAAFNGNFREKAGTMNLVEDDVHAFEHFVRWVYERDMDIPLEGDKDHLMVRMRELIEVYLLADKYDIPALKNHIIQILFNAVKYGGDKKLHVLRIPSLEDVQYIYANTARGSTLQRFVIECMTWFVPFEMYLTEFVVNWLDRNPEIAADLATKFAFRLASGMALREAFPLNEVHPFAKGKDSSVFLEPIKSDHCSQQM